MTRPTITRRAALAALLLAPSASLAREWTLQNGYYQELPPPGSRSDPQGYYAPPQPGDTGEIDPGPRSDRAALARRSPIPRRIVEWPGPQAPGEIVISTSERRLRFILDDHKALEYGVGVGSDGFAWHGVETITRKAEWPGWTPPPEMLQRRPALPRHMAGGINNPLGARAMYLGASLYRIHGTNEPKTIGHAVSSGCIRMANPDVIDLYNRARVGARVTVE